MTGAAVDLDSASVSGPDQVLASWGVSGRELFDAFVLDRAPGVHGRLKGRARLTAAPYERVGVLRAGDVLVRGAVGENRVLVAVLVDGELVDAARAAGRGWHVETAGPGCFAWVVEDEPVARAREERWARRVADVDGFMLVGQAVVRPTGSVPVESWWGFDPTESVALGLRSARFSGDDTLAAVAAGQLRLAAAGSAPVPAPVLSSGPAVAKVQQALIDVGFPLPQFGADGTFGGETGVAVSKFKTSRNIHPADPVVGRATITALDTELLAHERSNPSPQPDPQPSPPPDPGPSPPTGRMQPGDHLWHYNGLISPDNDIPRKWFPGATKKDRYEGRGDEINHYVLHVGDQVYCGQPHMNGRPGTWAWMNNNPGNITHSGMNLGQYPNKVSWHEFLIFPSYEIGFKAIADLMRKGRYPKSSLGPGDFYRNLGIADAFRHYAPSGDGGNDPGRYGRQVAEALGVPETTRVGDLDDLQMLRMQQKIQEIEGTRAGRILPRDHPDLPPAVRAALS